MIVAFSSGKVKLEAVAMSARVRRQVDNMTVQAWDKAHASSRG